MVAPESESRSEAPPSEAPAVLLLLREAPPGLECALDGADYRLSRAASLREARAVLRRQPVDIIIVRADATDAGALRFLRETQRLAPGAKKLVLTDACDADSLLKLTNQGGADFVLPGRVTPRALQRAIRRLWAARELESAWVRSHDAGTPLSRVRPFHELLEQRVRRRTRELSRSNEKLRAEAQRARERNQELSRQNRSLKIQSTTDHLTGLLNRREFLSRLRVEWGRFRRYHRPLSLIMMDIDHFKRVNDTYGHECGDTVLTTLASLIRRHQRVHDITCRYGGEEFLILMPETPLRAAFHVAEGLRRLVGGHAFRCKQHGLEVRVSMGVSGAIEHDPDGIEHFIDIADRGMYAAKREGRNLTVIIDRDDPQRIMRRTRSRAEGRKG